MPRSTPGYRDDPPFRIWAVIARISSSIAKAFCLKGFDARKSTLTLDIFGFHEAEPR